MVVIQSYCAEGGKEWVYKCTHSVKDWAETAGYSYVCYGDNDVLNVLPDGFLEKVGPRWAILTDYARLAFMKQQLQHHAEVLWLDADVFIHAPEKMSLPRTEAFCLGAEVWVADKVHTGVHNAFCYFQRKNPFLDFYLYACERLITQFSGQKMPPQFLGPKLLKHYDTLLDMPKTETIAMISPRVAQALVDNDDEVLSLQRGLDKAGGMNLCHSLLSDEVAEQVILTLRSGQAAR